MEFFQFVFRANKVLPEADGASLDRDENQGYRQLLKTSNPMLDRLTAIEVILGCPPAAAYSFGGFLQNSALVRIFFQLEPVIGAI